jgi:hypothetical protein
MPEPAGIESLGGVPSSDDEAVLDAPVSSPPWHACSRAGHVGDPARVR